MLKTLSFQIRLKVGLWWLVHMFPALYWHSSFSPSIIHFWFRLLFRNLELYELREPVRSLGIAVIADKSRHLWKINWGQRYSVFVSKKWGRKWMIAQLNAEFTSHFLMMCLFLFEFRKHVKISIFSQVSKYMMLQWNLLNYRNLSKMFWSDCSLE